MDQTSTFGPYFFLESSSGAAYAGLPHWVLKGSEYPKIPAQLLRPKSEEGQRVEVSIVPGLISFFSYNKWNQIRATVRACKGFTRMVNC